MDEYKEISSARSSPCQSSVEKAEDDIHTECSTKGSTTNDLDDKARTNDRTRISKAKDKIEKHQQEKGEDGGERSVSSWHETDNTALRGPLSDDQETSGAEESNRKMNNKKEFLWKIHELLEEISNEQKEHIVSWSPRGTSFQVHNPEAFVKEVMPRYSTATQFRSFEKMLNLYDFKKIKGGPQRGGYQHPMFRRDDRELCKNIKMRPKPKRKSKESRGSRGGRKSHVDHDLVGRLDRHFSHSVLETLEEEDDQHLSSIEDISMGYFQQMTATPPSTNIGSVPPTLQNQNASFVQSMGRQATSGEVHPSNLYPNVMDMRSSHHLSSIDAIGGMGSSSGASTMLMKDASSTSASPFATNQQRFTMFDHSMIPPPPSTTSGSAASLVVPMHLADSPFDHSAARRPSAVAVTGSLLQPPTTMVGSGFGVVGGMVPSLPVLMSGPSIADHAPSMIGTTMTTRSATTPSATPPMSETRIHPTSLEPPTYSHFLDLGIGGAGAGSGNIFVDHVAATRQQARRRSYSSTMASRSGMTMSSSSSLSFEPTIRSKHHHDHQEEEQQKGDDDHSKEVERMIFEEPLSDDLEPTHLPPRPP